MSNNPKVALIGGESRGIAAGLIQGYLELGYKVVSVARLNKPDVSTDRLAFAGDITDAKLAEQVMGDTVEKFGRVDTLVNNAGVFLRKPLKDYTEAEFSEELSLSLAGYVPIFQLAVHQMRIQGGGHIVNVAIALADGPLKRGTTASTESLPGGGLNEVTKALSIKHADQGIRINAVAPYFDMRTFRLSQLHGQRSALHSFGRMGHVAHVVHAVLELESASKSNGCVWLIDEGLCA